MKIGIVGSGSIGANAARLFVRAGHEVALSNSRGGQGLEALVEELGDRSHATTIEDAAKFGEVVLIAIPFDKYRTLPQDAFKGKVVIDAGNYYPERDGKFPELDGDETTSSEMMASHLKEARWSKALTQSISNISPVRATRVCRWRSGARFSSPVTTRRR